MNNTKNRGGKAKHNPTTVNTTITVLMINTVSFITNQ